MSLSTEMHMFIKYVNFHESFKGTLFENYIWTYVQMDVNVSWLATLTPLFNTDLIIS